MHGSRIHWHEVIALDNHAVKVKTCVLEDTLKYNNETVLTYKIEYPEFSSTMYQLSLVVINRFYRDRALEFQATVEGEMYDNAVEQYKFAVEHGFPPIPYEALVEFKLTYKCPCILSLYTDQYTFTGGAHGSTLRSSQTWNLQKCRRVRLRELIGCTTNYQEYVQKRIKAQIEENHEPYFEDYEKLLVQTFNPDSFYCTRKGVVVYYQQYDIAPYSSGIREFLLPYSDCVYDPQDTCFSIC